MLRKPLELLILEIGLMTNVIKYSKTTRQYFNVNRPEKQATVYEKNECLLMLK